MKISYILLLTLIIATMAQSSLFLAKKEPSLLSQELFRVTHNSATESYPSWSPDGRKIAYHSNKGGNWDIWMVEVKSGKINRLTKDKHRDLCPSWSSDGVRIAFMSDRSGYFEIWCLDLKRDKLQQITDFKAGFCGYPSWSPHSKELLFVWNGEIWSQNLQEYKARQISTQRGRYQDPSVSPDGKWIAATCNKGGRYKLWLIGKGKEILLPIKEIWWRGRPVWAPDGKMIAYSSYYSGFSEIWLVNKDGKGEKQMTYLEADSKFPCWSPDGKSMAFSSDKAGSKDIWIILLE